MIRTLDKYIDEQVGERSLLQSLSDRARRDPRFNKLLVLSFVAHLIFYAAVIQLDSLRMQRVIALSKRRSELVRITELAPPPDRVTLRAAPEPLERADLSRLRFDPETANDVQLIPRSPRPQQQKGLRGKLPTADQIERQLRASRGAGLRDSAGRSAHETSPPTTSPVQASGLAQSESATISTIPSLSPAPAPPASPGVEKEGPHETARDQASAGTRRGDSAHTAALALQAAEGQYMAYVRAKIRKANERIMPRDWIKDMLNDKVSADFTVVIARNGSILSTRLARSTGYSVLDDSARQAIFTASPFEGFPQEAGNSLTFTVTVYFFTL